MESKNLKEIITLNASNLIQTNKKYNFNLLMQDINKLKEAYPFLEIGNIGYSVLGKRIPYIKIGKGKKELLYHAAIHSNEWITSVLLIKFIEQFCKGYINNTNIYSKLKQENLAKKIFSEVSLYMVPMVNPDGIDLVTGNIEKNSDIYYKYLSIAKNYSSIPFPDGWKANFNGESFINFHLFIFKK